VSTAKHRNALFPSAEKGHPLPVGEKEKLRPDEKD
jgi:hypothetical protein